MARKLKIEIDVDTEKTKRKIKELSGVFDGRGGTTEEPGKKRLEISGNDFRKAEEVYKESREWVEKLESINTVNLLTPKPSVPNAKNNPSNQTIQNVQTIKQLNKPEYPLNHVSETVNKPLMSALDALSRIGGNFGGGDLGRDQLNVQREMAATLKSLDQKATNGGGIWQ